jgi:hypothetical protein
VSTDQTQTVLAKLMALPPERLREVEDFIDFLQQRSAAKGGVEPAALADFPVDEAGRWPADLSLHRADLYGDDGR